MSTSESWGVNGHTTRCTGPVCVVLQFRLVSGWGLHETEISAAPWALEAREGLYFTIGDPIQSMSNPDTASHNRLVYDIFDWQFFVCWNSLCEWLDNKRQQLIVPVSINATNVDDMAHAVRVRLLVCSSVCLSPPLSVCVSLLLCCSRVCPVLKFSDFTLWCPLLPYGYTATAIKHPVPCQTGLSRSFVIFDIRALWRSALSVRVPGCQKLQMAA